jgi:hypothetical protein
MSNAEGRNGKEYEIRSGAILPREKLGIGVK